MSYVRWFETLGTNDVGIVGGKNASLGEMICTLKGEGIRVPDGFATTAEAYWKFLEANDLIGGITGLLNDLKNQKKPLDEVGKAIRSLFLHAEFPEDIAQDIRKWMWQCAAAPPRKICRVQVLRASRKPFSTSPEKRS